MQNIIQHLIIFDKLFLIWQAPQDPSRRRYVVGELLRQGEEVSLRYLNDSKDFMEAKKHGFEGYPAFRLDKTEHRKGVLDAFMLRLPPKSRADFKEYLQNLCLPSSEDNQNQISDFSLLGYSGARLLSDNFSIIPNFENVTGPCEFLMDIAGFRHASKIPIQDIEIGTKVTFAREPENVNDKNAICILLGGQKIGYVTRAHLPAFHRWLNAGYQLHAQVQRKTEQGDFPVVFLFVAVSPS